MIRHAHLQLVVNARHPAIQEALNALVLSTTRQPLPSSGTGCRFIAADGTRLFDVAFDGSPACLLDLAALAAYLRMSCRVEWMMAVTPDVFDARGEGLDEALGVTTGPSLLVILQYREGGTYSGLAITGPAIEGGWQVSVLNVEQGDGRSASKLLGWLDDGIDDPARAARLPAVLRDAADAFLAQGQVNTT